MMRYLRLSSRNATTVTTSRPRRAQYIHENLKERYNTMNIKPGDCNTKIMVYVDTTQIMNGSDDGVYMIDNRGEHSQGAGSANLDTSCPLDDFVCWQIRPMDYHIGDSAEIVGFNQSHVWAGHKPRKYKETDQEGKSAQKNQKPVTSWITRVSEPGSYPYSFTVNVTDFDDQLKAVQVTGTHLSVGN